VVEENRSEIRKAIAAIRVGAENLGGMAGEIQGAVQENRAGLKVAVDNIGAASGSINTVVVENRDSIKAGIDNIRIMAEQIAVTLSENRDQIRAAIGNLSKAGDQVGEAVKENRAAIKQTADSLAAFGPKLERIGDNLELITAQIAKGQGTIGRLVMEDTLYTKTEDTLDSAQQRLDEVKPFTSGFSDLRFYPGVSYDQNVDSGRSTGTAYLRIEPRPWKYYEFGVSYRSKPDDLTKPAKEDPDKLNIDFRALFGWRFLRDDEAQVYRLTVGAGFIDSNLGGLANLALTRDLSIEVMARDKSNNREVDDRRYEEGKALLRASASYRLWERIYLSAGADDLLDEPGLWGGVRGEILDDDIRNFFSVTSVIK
jgi:phospholipid/cholesterol/gamma-HCH transport system substrate-binding protein